jgi:hypothetical protein
MKDEQIMKQSPKRQISFRLSSGLCGEIRQIAESDERDLTWVLTKIIELGLPIFKEQQKT